MMNNDTWKVLLVNIHAMSETACANRDRALKYFDSWQTHATNRTSDIGLERMKLHKGSIEKQAIEALEWCGKATFLASNLLAMMDDMKERNAVVLNALNAVADGHKALIDIRDALQYIENAGY